ncbi:MAG: S8 family serine peptidase, partial [Pirellula sp.]
MLANDIGMQQEEFASGRYASENESWSIYSESGGQKSKSLHATTSEHDALQLVVDGRNLGVSVHADRIVLPTRVFGAQDFELQEKYRLSFVRHVNEHYAMYDIASGPDIFSLDSDLATSALVEQWVPVLVIEGSKSDAVLLDEVVVSLKEGVDAQNYFANAKQFTSYAPLAGTDDQFVVKVDGAGISTLAIANELDADPQLNWASPNFYQSWQRYFSPNDTRFGSQWYLHNTGQGGGAVDADVDIPEAWDILAGGSSNITVGIVDDGISIDHPDLNAWVNIGEVSGNGIDDDGNGWIDDVHGWNFVTNTNQSMHTTSLDKHGTAVAGLIAAKGENAIGIAGASYRSRVLSARIFESGIPASDANIASALYYAAGRKASGVGTWKAADVINNSWGGGAPSSVIQAALLWGTTMGRQGKGAAFLFSAGNESSSVSEPAAQSLNIPGVIAIGSTNNFGALSDYSNYGSAIDFVLPSDDSRPGYLGVDTTDRLGAEGFVDGDYTGSDSSTFGGTSASTALASGITALVLAQAESVGAALSPVQIRGLLRNNTDLIDASSTSYDPFTGKNDRFGYGRLNAASAVEAIGKPEISVVSDRQVLQNALSVSDFGNVYVGDASDIMYRIRNQGTAVLNLTGLSISSGPYVIQSGLSRSSLGVGESTNFTIRLESIAVGIATATISIQSNDNDESSFSFQVTSHAIAPSIGGSVYEDWNGNGSKDSIDQLALPDQIVYLDSNNNATFDSNQDTAGFSQFNSVVIPDLSTVMSTLNVTGTTDYITDVNMTINLTHTMVSDLQVSLVSPSGRTVMVFDRTGDRGGSMTGTILDDEAMSSIALGESPFTGSYRPSAGLWAFDGERANGIWTLVVSDLVQVDAGLLLNWSLNFTVGEQSTRTPPNGYDHFVGL